MSILKKESFEEFFTSEKFYVKNTSHITRNIYDFSIKRDENLDLVFTSFSEEKKVFNRENYKKNNSKIEFSSIYSSFQNATLNGVIINNQEITNKINGHIIKEKSSVNSLEVFLQNNEPSYLVEWVLNFKCNYILDFPFKFFNKNQKTFTVDELQISDNNQSEEYRSCIKIEMENFSIYIGKSLEETKKDSAFILYSKNIEEKERNKIRNCISFILGIPLIYLGYTSFLKDGTIQGVKAISAYDYNGAFKISSLPPSLLSEDGSNLISSKVFSHKVNTLYRLYDKYNFQHLFWLYFHARTSNIQVSAGQYGGAIEFLQSRYLKENEFTINTKLFDNKEEWDKFKQKLFDETANLNLNNELQNVLKNKINSLNSLPFNIKLNRFLESLDTKLSKLEKKAWQQRNDSAHGNVVKDNDYINLIKEINVLMCLFNRLIFLVTKSSNDYINYKADNLNTLCIYGIE